MRTKQLVLVAWLALFGAACAGATRNPRPHSQAGTVAHGEFVTVPWGTLDDWNIIVAPMQMGVEEPNSEEDNRLLRFRTFATVQSPTTWQITALYRFAYAADNVNIHWVEGSANYLMVPKNEQ
jgi:hypothetical protein